MRVNHGTPNEFDVAVDAAFDMVTAAEARAAKSKYRLDWIRTVLAEEVDNDAVALATLTAERDEARGMALTEVTDLLRNVLSRSLVSATEKLIVEVILDKIEALKAGAK